MAAGLALTTALALAVLLTSLGALLRVSAGVAVASLVCGGLALLAFGLPRLVVGPIAAAVAGLVLYVAALALWRPSGLRQAWAYVRTLQ